MRHTPTMPSLDHGSPIDILRAQEALHAACCQAEVAALPATIISEAISSYLYGWGSRDAESEADVALAVVVLNQAAGGTGDAVVQAWPTDTTLSDQAMAKLMRIVLLMDGT